MWYAKLLLEIDLFIHQERFNLPPCKHTAMVVKGTFSRFSLSILMYAMLLYFYFLWEVSKKYLHAERTPSMVLSARPKISFCIDMCEFYVIRGIGWLSNRSRQAPIKLWVNVLCQVCKRDLRSKLYLEVFPSSLLHTKSELHHWTWVKWVIYLVQKLTCNCWCVIT